MKSYKSLKTNLDRIFSTYIRTRDSNYEGVGSCVTCGHTAPLEQLQCGHFQSRIFLITRWDELNAHIQCGRCNNFGGGEQYKMSKYINKKYGKGTAEKLEKKSKKRIKLSRVDLQEMIEETEAKLMAL